MSDADLHTKWWQLDAGLRFLRMTSPENAEYCYAFEIEQTRLLQDLLENETLNPNGAYNVIRREVTGRKRNITFFPDGSGRSWAGEIPDEFKHLPTIEPIVPEAASLNAVISFLSQVVPGLPDYVANDARIRLSEIEAQKAPITLPSDLSPLTMKSQSIEEARLRAQRAIVILDFLDTIYLSAGHAGGEADIGKFAARCRNAYESAGLSGVLYAPLLLLLEIVEAAKPTLPFGRGRPSFVCGQMGCDHVICKENIGSVLAEGARMGSWLAHTLMPRNLHAYVLSNEADFSRLLDSVSAVPRRTTWIEQAARTLLSRGKTERAKLAEALTVFDFYTLHYRFLPFFKAAQIGFEYLVSCAVVEAERKEYERLMNLAEEYGARSLSALTFDFFNSVDFTRVVKLRALYLSTAKQSQIAANMFLQKWIHDETLIPAFWSDYVSGKAEGVRFPAAPAAGA